MTYSDDVQYLWRRIFTSQDSLMKERLHKCAKLMMKAEEIYQREQKKNEQ